MMTEGTLVCLTLRLHGTVDVCNGCEWLCKAYTTCSASLPSSLHAASSSHALAAGSMQ